MLESAPKLKSFVKPSSIFELAPPGNTNAGLVSQITGRSNFEEKALILQHQARIISSASGSLYTAATAFFGAAGQFDVASLKPNSRPPNSWILYSRDMRYKYHSCYSCDAVKFIAADWQNESEQVKRYYANLANQLKEKHNEMYPEFVFKPKPSKRRPRKKVAEIITPPPSPYNQTDWTLNYLQTYKQQMLASKALILCGRRDVESDFPMLDLNATPNFGPCSPTLFTSDPFLNLDLEQMLADAKSNIGMPADAPFSSNKPVFNPFSDCAQAVGKSTVSAKRSHQL